MNGDVSTRLLMNTIGYVGQLAISLGENNNKSHDDKNYMSNCVSAQFPTRTAGNLPNQPISLGKIGVTLFLASQSRLIFLPFFWWLASLPFICHIKYSKQARTRCHKRQRHLGFNRRLRTLMWTRTDFAF